MEYSEEHNIFKCTKCGDLVITGMDEQPPEVCEKCEEIKALKGCLDTLYYITNYCGFRNNNCAICEFHIYDECGFTKEIPENWTFLEKIKKL